MVHLFELAHAVAILDELVHPSAVDRALKKTGLNRQLIRSTPGFVPYSIEAVLLESVARAVGEPNLGAHVGKSFDYGAYQAYGEYVLGADSLGSALARGREAMPLVHPGAHASITPRGRTLVLSFDTGLGSIVGNRHLAEGAIFVLSSICRHFLGSTWRPEWIGVAGSRVELSTMEDLTGVPVHRSTGRAELAIRMDDAAAPNPESRSAGDIVALGDLPALMGTSKPRTAEDHVRAMLLLQQKIGEVSVEAVAARLSLGPRTLQRLLQSEGTTFREVRARFIQDRARALLRETNLPVETIGRTLGYDEPRSFRRAFRLGSGLSPVAFRSAFKNDL